jgi:peptidyl-prolyl cis-trans isomerase C
VKNVTNDQLSPDADRRRPSPLAICLRYALGLSLLPLAAAARADAALIQGPLPEVAVTAADVRTELITAPDSVRSQLTSDRDVLMRAITALYQRKAMVAAAKAAGLERLPEVQARVERAREQIYATALTQKEEQDLSARIPDMTARAAELYQAHPDRYLTPTLVRVRHILLKADTDDAAAARRPEAEDLLKQLQAGADFAELAAKSSQDTANAKEGGALPAFKRGDMVKPFEDAAFGLQQPGDLSPVVRSKFGLHLIRLEEVQPGRQRTFDEVKESIIAKLSNDWVVEARQAWVQGLVDPSKMTIDQPALDALVAEIIAAGPPAPGATVTPAAKGR